MENQRINEILEKTGTLQTGHFRLTSGRHSAKYMQCARLFEYADYSEELCRILKEKINEKVDLVAGPALGAVIMAYEMSRQFSCPNIFTEREDGKMSLRRGFHVPQGARVLVVEDVITTGGSVKEVIEIIESAGASVCAVGCIVDRTGGGVDFNVPLYSVIKTQIETYEEKECPLCKDGIEIVKPGSRKS